VHKLGLGGLCVSESCLLVISHLVSFPVVTSATHFIGVSVLCSVLHREAGPFTAP